MTFDTYVATLRDLLSGDPAKVQSANERLFKSVVTDGQERGPLSALLAADNN